MKRICYMSLATKENVVAKHFSNLSFVPKHEAVCTHKVEQLQELIDSSPRILILTGAGISTESGIPDYRSEAVGLYARSNHKPIQHQDFMKYKHVRQRYWARNYFGWPKFSAVKPNNSHEILARWEKEGKTSVIVTQNVDRLHHKAGSKSVIELHGCAYEVKCMNCNHTMSRYDFQKMLTSLNPHLKVERLEVRPDADVELSQDIVNLFKVPACDECSNEERGFFKPDIVFFGDNVPRPRVESVLSQLEASDLLLVLGSSLHVYSGYRFILRANELGKPITIVNIGPTRGDKHALLKVDGKCSDVLSKLCF